MLKSCSYCGRIHDSKYMCEEKKQKIKERQSYRTEQGAKARSFHNSKIWQDKRESIKTRDNYCCQLCIRGLHQPIRQFETENISVHHILPLSEDYERRLDDYNLVTLCPKHHEEAEKGSISRIELFRIVEDQERKNSCPVCG